jgi:hypothetical protein
MGIFTPQTSYDLYLGLRPGDGGYFQGNLDEMSLYNRALSSNEIAAIYNAGSGGKCLTSTPPVITSQPTNQTVAVGQTAIFSVSASGTLPLSYQWTFNTTNIAGATNNTLTLTNVQFSQAGTYAVVVSNLADAVLSSNATLTVNPPPPCDPPPSGLVSWWRAEGNALDSVGTNNGVLENGAGFGPGEVGQAFLLNSVNADVHVPASASLNVGTNSGLTIEGWINPAQVATQMPIVEWNHNSGVSGIGVIFWLSVQITSPGVGNLVANIGDTSGGSHVIYSADGLMVANSFQHVALTYDRTTGVAVLYRNGVPVQTQNMGIFTPQTSYDLYLGLRPGDGGYFQGNLDEMSLYNRALSSNEIEAIYLAGSGGKCFTPTPPVITSQPTNQIVVVGQTATFSVSASGTLPLSYQWTFNTTNIAGATNSTLTLTNVQFSQAGTYAVVVSNLVNSVLSSNATLTVLIPAAIITQPTNQMVYVGGTASFGVIASGTSPLSYQWNFNTTNIANATNTTLVLTNVQLNQAGNYAVLVSNLVNSILSSNAVLTVNPTPALGVVPSGNFLLMFWPVSAPGFVMETSPSLSPADWVPVPNPPIQIGSEYLESIQMTGTNQFFRLRFIGP